VECKRKRDLREKRCRKKIQGAEKEKISRKCEEKRDITDIA